jgi:hypothetical protein
MRKFLIVLSSAVALALSAGGTFAQVIPPGTQFNPPLTQAPPPPRIEVPRVPRMDELPSRNYVPAPRPSFGEKITTCLQEGAAAGLAPGERDAHARACANSR